MRSYQDNRIRYGSTTIWRYWSNSDLTHFLSRLIIFAMLNLNLANLILPVIKFGLITVTLKYLSVRAVRFKVNEISCYLLSQSVTSPIFQEPSLSPSQPEGLETSVILTIWHNWLPKILFTSAAVRASDYISFYVSLVQILALVQ